MKFFRFILPILALTLAFSLRAALPTFADISWGSTQAEVQGKMLEKNFNPGTPTPEGDLLFRGNVLNRPALVTCMFGKEKLLRIDVKMILADGEAITYFRQVRSIFLKKYGPTPFQFEQLAPPYHSGDGNADQAIRVGKGRFNAIWKYPNDAGVILNISQKLDVRITYVTAEWYAEGDRRKSAGKSPDVF
jgi:hypothetical protein